jgi:hypothetical protein
MLSTSIKTKLNDGDGVTSFTGLGTALDKHVNSLKCTYDFANQGGAIGDIALKDFAGNNAVIPSGAIIRDVIIYVETALTSGGSATIAVKAQSAADLKAATAVASYSLAAVLAGVPVGTAATAIALTADRTVTITVAVAALTAGKMHVYVDYVF